MIISPPKPVQKQVPLAQPRGLIGPASPPLPFSPSPRRFSSFMLPPKTQGRGHCMPCPLTPAQVEHDTLTILTPRQPTRILHTDRQRQTGSASPSRRRRPRPRSSVASSQGERAFPFFFYSSPGHQHHHSYTPVSQTMGGVTWTYKVVPLLLSSLALQSVNVAGQPAAAPATPYVMPFAAPEVSYKERIRARRRGHGREGGREGWREGRRKC